MYELFDGIIKVLGQTLIIERMLQKEIYNLKISLVLTVFGGLLLLFYVVFLHYSNLKRIRKIEKKLGEIK